jgi:micrococcal nuclease
MFKNIAIIILTIVVLVLLFKFGIIADIIDFLDTNSEDTVSQQEVNTDNINQSEEDGQTVNSFVPVLDDLDYTNMKLFEDGYEIVSLVSHADGDTAIFKVSGREYKTRFLAIDTPEVDPERREVAPWGKYASDFTKSKLKNAKEIILELDADSDIFDKYDRLLSWVWVDGKLLNYLLVDEGAARVAYLYGDYKYTYYLEDAEITRQSEGVKIWGEIDPDFDYNSN